LCPEKHNTFASTRTLCYLLYVFSTSRRTERKYIISVFRYRIVNYETPTCESALKVERRYRYFYEKSGFHDGLKKKTSLPYKFGFYLLRTCWRTTYVMCYTYKYHRCLYSDKCLWRDATSRYTRHNRSVIECNQFLYVTNLKYTVKYVNYWSVGHLSFIEPTSPQQYVLVTNRTDSYYVREDLRPDIQSVPRWRTHNIDANMSVGNSRDAFSCNTWRRCRRPTDVIFSLQSSTCSLVPRP